MPHFNAESWRRKEANLSRGGEGERKRERERERKTLSVT